VSPPFTSFRLLEKMWFAHSVLPCFPFTRFSTPWDISRSPRLSRGIPIQPLSAIEASLSVEGKLFRETTILMRVRTALSSLFLAVILSAFLLFIPSSVPTFDEVVQRTSPSTVVIQDRTGYPFDEIRTDFTRRRSQWIPIDTVPTHLVDLLILQEDRAFFEHSGVNMLSLGAAALGVRRGGASTITMQLATLLERDRRRSFSWFRKARQIIRAGLLERRWSKREILEAYLNLVPFRGESIGIGAASRTLFGKAVHGLSVPEAARMIAMLPSPNAAEHVVADRAARLLRLRGDAPRAFTHSAPAHIERLAPHAARYIARLGRSPGRKEIRSTIDRSLQRLVIQALERHLDPLRDRRVRDGAVLVVHNRTGEVLAYVGSSGSRASAPHVDGVRARRQAGSTLKPFLYAVALDERILTAQSVLDDSPLEVVLAAGSYRPRNYDNRFHGPVSLRTALASSLNVPAVRTLDLIQVASFEAALHRLGFSGLQRGDFYGLSLALGSPSISLWELVNAYRTLAQGGVRDELRMIMNTPSGEKIRVFSEGASFIVTDVLADREARSLSFGLENEISTPYRAAVKTGTSRDMVDNWCIGYTSHFTVGVWVGNSSGIPMQGVTGISGAGPIFREVMDHLNRQGGYGSEAFRVPSGVVKGASVTDHRAFDWYLEGTEPSGVHIVETVPKIRYPVEGTMIAYDADIPPENQQLVFRSEGAGEGYDFVLDGAVIGRGGEAVPWKVTRGRHVASLVDREGSIRDRVTFLVR
jgi:penicillin-binding protein 1C